MRTLIVLCFLAMHYFAPVVAEASEPIEKLQRKFLMSVASADVDAAYNLMHPSLKELVDEPVFTPWVKAVNERLGELKEIKTESSKRQQLLAGVQHDMTSLLKFERGEAVAELTFFADRLIAFHVQSNELGDWFRGPSDIHLYVHRSRQFIESFFDSDVPGTRSMMHEALREAVSGEQLATMMSQTQEHAGRMISAELQGQKMAFDDGRQTLTLVFDMACAKAAGEIEIKFQFVGMKGHLLAFHIR